MIGTARHVLLSLVTSALALHLTAQSQQTAPTNPVIDAVTSQLRALAHLTVDGWRFYADRPAPLCFRTHSRN